MNTIILSGIIKNIQFSHKIDDIEYYKANLLVTRENGKEDLINLKFKKFSNQYKDGDKITLIGNVRTYSQRLIDRNKVEVYVFTYFDKPEEELSNNVTLSGRICKKNALHKTKEGKDVLDFIIANKIEGQSLNCYIPCVAWGKQAKEIETLGLGKDIEVKGELRSREYKKKINENNFEIRIAHEININEYMNF